MGRKILFIFVFVFAFTAGYLYITREAEEIRNYPPRGTKVLAFGDSLVQGIGATPGQDFVSRISRDLGVPIVNMGRSGDTTAKGLSRVDSALSHSPDVVMLLLGGNDALRRVSVEETKTNLRTMIHRFQEAGSVVMLIGVRGGIASDPYSTMYRSLAEETQSILVTDVLRGLFGDRRYMADLVHPNDAGHEVIARRITLQLSSVLDEAKN